MNNITKSDNSILIEFQKLINNLIDHELLGKNEASSLLEQLKNLFKSRFEQFLGNSIKLNFSIVDKIDPASSGKSKLVISNYDPPK